MNFSKDSWHFRFAHTYGDLRNWEGQPIQTSLCEYVKHVALGLLYFSIASAAVVFVTIFGIGGFIALFAHGFSQWVYFGPFLIASATIMIIAGVLAIAGVLDWKYTLAERRMTKAWDAYLLTNPDASYYAWYLGYKKASTYKANPSIIKEWFKAKKEKVCPIITIE